MTRRGVALGLVLGLAATLTALPGGAHPAVAAPTDATTATHGAPVTVDGAHRLLVRWAAATSAAVRAETVAAAAAAVGATVTERTSVTGDLDVLLVPSPLDALQGALAGSGVVRTAEPDRWLVQQHHHVPNATLFPQQWGLHNDGRPVAGTPATAGVDVRALDAWTRTRGHTEVVVAVIDSGVDLEHPDLAAAIWTNPGEQRDGRDTDGNGFVDDVNGWNFVDDSPDVSPASFYDWHGTAVTGVIAADADNGIGVAGLAPDVRVLPIKAFAADESGVGRGTTANAVAAFEYAALMGADVVNASWFNTIDSPLLFETIRDLGLPVVAAAGNNGHDLTAGTGTAFPAAYRLPNLVSVTAVAPDGTLPRFANVGRRHVDVGGPGVRIYTTTPGDWLLLDGTSFAAPFVSAALALARSVEPDAPVDGLIDAVSWTSRVVPATSGTTVSGGMLDAAALLHGVHRPACPWTTTPPRVFSDVDPAATHADAIACLDGHGIIRGTGSGTFGPDTPLTRAQLATVLTRVLSWAEVELPSHPPDAFVDDAGSVHEHAINQLAALGLAQGTGDGRFRPAGSVTRAQLASFAVRVQELVTGESHTPSRSWFEDAARSSHADGIHVARDLGIVRGTATLEFMPARAAHRDEVASVVARLLDAIARSGEPEA